jgi:DNA-binding phage protein
MNMQQIARDYKETVETRLRNDPAYAAALLDEAVSLFLSGEPGTARIILRELVNATVGFEKLALETERPSKSLHRMLSAGGNPTMNNLTRIIGILRRNLNVNIEVRTVPCHQ